MFIDNNSIPYAYYDDKIQTSILSVAEWGLYLYNYIKKENLLLSYPWKNYFINIVKQYNIDSEKTKEYWPVNFDESRPKNDIEATEMLIKCSDWLLARIKKYKNCYVWEHKYHFSYNTNINWSSSHSQSASILLLVKTYEITKNNKYMEPIDLLLNAFNIPVCEGGLFFYTKNNNFWFQKLADKERKGEEPKILNGHLFTLIYLDIILDNTKKYNYKFLLDKGLKTLKEYLPIFFLDNMSYYSEYNGQMKKATDHYHKIHMIQLKILYKKYNLDF